SDAGAPTSTAVTEAEAIDLLYASMGKNETPPACSGAYGGALPCLIDARYAADEQAHMIAGAMYVRTGSVAGVVREHVMDGGYRGMLHLVPVLPTGADRVHLQRVAMSLDDYDNFFAALEQKGNQKVAYRWRDLALRFFRSVKARTPSAYASGWTVAYNVDGSLNHTDSSVRETMLHEIFHLNDSAHGEKGDDWSDALLEPTYEKIVGLCKTNTACLSKFAPNDTKVKGGTYYAFQPGNDVREYAAELAVRYYKEERGMLGMGPVVKTPFKCTGAENEKSWDAMAVEFFGGIDLTASCP
ncbi:MAG: hypothetical protein ACRELY_28385, partial [Polyangiaceae bacterium]